MQRGPGAEIVPSKVGRQTEDSRLDFSLGGARLQHRVVDADVFTLRVEPSKGFCELACAIGLGNLFEEPSRLRKMLAQRVRERVGAPEKHAAVPEVIARVEKLHGSGEIRLFGKAAHPQGAPLIGGASFGNFSLDITVAGFRASWADAEHNDVFSGGSNLDSAAESRTVFGWIRDYVVGGKQPENRVGIVPK